MMYITKHRKERSTVIRKILALVLALVLMAPALAMGEDAAGEVDYGKYDEPVTVSFLTRDFKVESTEYDVNNPDRKSAHENAWISACSRDMPFSSN